MRHTRVRAKLPKLS